MTALPFLRSRSRIADFALERPDTVADAVALLAAHGADATPMAGGLDLVNRMKFGAPVRYVVHLGRIAVLKTIALDDGGLTIGACARHDEIATDPGVRAFAPGLAELCALLANVRIRHKGTIGGNILAREPNYDLAPALHALGAELAVSRAEGDRVVPMAALDTIGAGDLLTAIRLPAARIPFAFARHLRPYIAVYLGFHAAGGVRLLRAGLGCAADHAVFAEIEAPAAGPADLAARLVAALPPLRTDHWVSAAYRKRTAGTLAQRLMQKLAEVPS